jgi:hypothetical protein
MATQTNAAPVFPKPPPPKQINWSGFGKGAANVLVGQPVNNGKSQITPLYDYNSGQFVGWQNSDGTYVQAGSTNGLAPMIYNPKPAGQQQGVQGAGPPGSAQGVGPPGSAGTAPSYLGAPGTTATGGSSPTASGTASTMATTGFGPTITQDQGPMASVTPEMARQFFVAQGGPAGIDDATAMAYFKRANPNYGMSGVNQQDAISYFVSQGGSPNIDPGTAISYYEKAHPQEVQAGVANAALTPEQRALGQVAKIDPTSEALRTAVAGSYLTPLQQAGAPKASDYQSYLDLYKQVDPQGFAMRQAQGQQVSDYVTKVTGQAPTSAEDALAKYAQLDPAGYRQMQQLGGAMGSQLTAAQQANALGSTLDAATAREVEQQTRAGQSARGNIYGTPQLVEEAMARGTAGEARAAQRRADLANASGAMQSYLSGGPTAANIGQAGYQQGVANRAQALGLGQSYLQSGTGLGDTAMNLYNQNQANLRAAQGGALSYLGSGQTPYQVGSGVLGGAEQAAAAAAQGGPQYNPASLGASYGAAQIPQYGLDTSQNVNQWYNSLSAYMNPGGASKNRGTAALGGGMSGALSGATAGAAMGGVAGGIGAVPGALIGGVAGGALGAGGGYFS